MIASVVSAWEPAPSELDELWCPLIEFVSGCAESDVVLLVEGGSRPSRPTFEGERHYLLRFTRVAAMQGYAEAFYNTFIRPADPDGPHTPERIDRAIQSELLDRALELQHGPLAHFRVSTGGMQFEIIAHPDFELRRFGSRAAALEAARSDELTRTRNFDVADGSGRAALEALRCRLGGKA